MLCDDVTGIWTTFCDILLMDKILHQLIGSLSHYLQGLIHTRRCRISSINGMSKVDPLQQGWSGGLLGVFCMFLLITFVTGVVPHFHFRRIKVFEVRTVWKEWSMLEPSFWESMGPIWIVYFPGLPPKMPLMMMMMMMMMMIPEVCPVSIALKRTFFLNASLKNCHQMPTPELDGFHKTYRWKNSMTWGKTTHMHHKSEVQEFFTLPLLQVLQEMRNRIASYEAIWPKDSVGLEVRGRWREVIQERQVRSSRDIIEVSK